MILQDIINRLDLYFPNVQINVDDVPQGLNTPCFFINCANLSLKREFQDRLWYDCLINVNYLSDNHDAFNRNDVRNKLIFALETIPQDYGGYIRAKDINITEDENDDLVATINYSVYVKDIKDKEEYMLRLKTIFKSMEE